MKANRKLARTARRLFKLCVVDGALDAKRVRTVARRLATSRARGSLTVLSAFHRLVHLDRARHTAVVESAAPLDAPVRNGLERELQRVYGAHLITAFSENPELLGGVRIRVGSDVYDGSIRGRLSALQARL